MVDTEGHGCRFSSDGSMHISALSYSVEAYTEADYQSELADTGQIYINIDGFHAGLGGDTGWSKNIHDEYLIPRGTYSYGFIVSFQNI